MKFTVYEVAIMHFDKEHDIRETFLYAEYKDAVNKFKELIEKAKQIDWIKEGLENVGNRKYVLEDTKLDYWRFWLDEILDYMDYEVSIEEREVH